MYTVLTFLTANNTLTVLPKTDIIFNKLSINNKNTYINIHNKYVYIISWAETAVAFERIVVPTTTSPGGRVAGREAHSEL